MPKANYEFSPFGTLDHPWINRADTKFVKEGEPGVFHTGLVLDGADAIAFKTLVDDRADAAHAAFWETEAGQRVKKHERPLWTAFRPYVVDTDDEGNPTGHIMFKFKQNSVLRLKDGATKTLAIGIKDSKGKPVSRPVFHGSEGRIMFTVRDILTPVNPKDKSRQIGVQLALAQVQVTKMAEREGPSFGAVDGGYEEGEADQASQHSATDTGGDY